MLVAVSQMLADLPELAELDINPLLADDDGVIALDARIACARAPRARATARFAIRPYPAELAETLVVAGSTAAGAPDPARRRGAAPRLRHAARARGHSPALLQRAPRAAAQRARPPDADRLRPRDGVHRPRSRMPDGSLRTLGVVRAVADPDNVEAEFAIIVGADLKGQGLGQLLLDKMIRTCGGTARSAWSRWCCARTRPCASWRRGAASNLTARALTTRRCAMCLS